MCEWHCKQNLFFFLRFCSGKCHTQKMFLICVSNNLLTSTCRFPCRCNRLLMLCNPFEQLNLCLSQLWLLCHQHFSRRRLCRQIVPLKSYEPIKRFFRHFMIKKNVDSVVSYAKNIFLFDWLCVRCVCAHALSLDVFEIKRCEFRILDAW